MFPYLFRRLEPAGIPSLAAPSSISIAVIAVFPLALLPTASAVTWPSHSDFLVLPLIGILVVALGPPDNPG